MMCRAYAIGTKIIYFSRIQRVCSNNLVLGEQGYLLNDLVLRELGHLFNDLALRKHSHPLNDLVLRKQGHLLNDLVLVLRTPVGYFSPPSVRPASLISGLETLVGSWTEPTNTD